MRGLNSQERIKLAQVLTNSLCKDRFTDFFRKAWKVLEPATPLLWNWHHDLICEYLQACHLRQIKRLVINIPPRYAKSNMATVAFPTWVWLHNPSERFLFGSHDLSLSTKHSVDRRRLMESEWYQKNWGNRVQFTGDQNLKTHYENTARGHMIAASMTGSGIGKGGNFIILDDPHDPKRAESDVQRLSVLENIDQKFSTRMDDKKNGVMILIMQRIHHLDATAHVLSKGGWEHLKIPAVEPVAKVYVFPLNKTRISRKEGDILHPEREGREQLEQQAKDMTMYAYSGQYQQEPTPRGGGMIQTKFFKVVPELPERFDEVVQFWDMATKDPEDKVTGKRSRVAVGVFGRVGLKKYVLYVNSRPRSFAQSVAAVIQVTKTFPKARRVLIEDKANGPAVVNVLKKQNKISGVMEWPVGTKSKEERFYVIEPDFEAGNWHVPEEVNAPWVPGFLSELEKFPKGEHDDQVDVWTGAGNYFVQRESKLRNLTML